MSATDPMRERRPMHFGYLPECPDGKGCTRPGCIDAHVDPDAGEALLRMISDPGATATLRLPHESTAAWSARAILASDWLDAVRRKAGDERAEQIAQAIDQNMWQFRRVTRADAGSPICRAYDDAARIARESR